jgi:predicted DsbA family dithiol-disulfide isomerase
VATLVGLAAEVGLDPAAARSALDGDAYADAVQADIRRARSFGIRGVPFFAVDATYGVSGAQPVGALLSVLEQAWTESHPLVPVGTGAPADGICEDDSCAI